MNPGASALVNGVLLSVPLAAVVWVVLRVIPRRALNAATRYAIWWTALACTLALPVRSFLAAPELRTPQGVLPGQRDLAVLTVDLPSASATAGGNRPLALPAISWLPAAWLLASVVLLARLLLSHLAVLRACRRATDPPPEWTVHARRWRDAAGFRRSRVRMAVSTEMPVPFAAGPFHPAIVIPARLFGQLDEPDLDRVGLHEAAHLARLDDAAILVERLLVALLPWHFVAWWIIHQIDREREIACDDRVVAETGGSTRYADCLTRVVELCGGLRDSAGVAGMTGRTTHLSQRVELLVDTPRAAGPWLHPARMLPFAAGLLALVVGSANAPRLIAFAALPTTLPSEKMMTSKTAKNLGQKLAVAAATTAALAAPAATAQTAAPQPQARVETSSAGRRIAFLIETNGVSAADLQRSIDAATRRAKSLQPGDQAALLVSTDHGVRVLQDFTSDAGLIVKSAQQVTSSGEGVTPQPGNWTSALGPALEMLGGIAGPKSLIYFTFGPAPDSAQSAALHYNAVRHNVTFVVSIPDKAGAK